MHTATFTVSGRLKSDFKIKIFAPVTENISIDEITERKDKNDERKGS